MVPLSPSLLAHQKSHQRRPDLYAVVTARRGGMELLRWARLYTGAEADGPHAAALANDGSLIRARVSGTQLYVSRVASPSPGSTFSSWTSLAAVTAGSYVAIAARAGEVLLIVGDNTALKRWSSADDGATWSGPTTIVTEASAIGPVAVAFNPSGDACAFYALGAAGTTLKRLRRTSGTWAGSGTNWSRSASVASVNGIGACHDGLDFALLVTGKEVTTTNPRCWAVGMGDLGLPANLWTSLVAVAEADAASTVTFAGPKIATTGGTLRGTLARVDTGPKAATRVMESRPQAFAGVSGPWSEPIPTDATSAYGLALVTTSGSTAWSASPSGVWSAARGLSLDVSANVTACRYRLSPRGSSCTLELTDPTGELVADPALFAGANLNIAPGYGSGTAAALEIGTSIDFAIDRIRTTRSNGRRVVTLDAVGPWELMRRWHAPQSWQAAAGAYSRSSIFSRTVARAALSAADAGIPQDPGGEWISGSPAFALAVGETAASAAERLLDAVAAETVHGSGLTVRSVDAGDTEDRGFGDASQAPIFELETVDAVPAAAWFRMQGDGHVADAFDTAAIAAGSIGLAPLTDRQRASDSAVQEGADAAVHRAAMLTPAAVARVPFDCGLEVFDVVSLTDGTAGFAGDLFRIIELQLDYRRGPQLRYDAVLTLGAR